MNHIAKEFFAQAASEVSSGHLDQALYIKALALSSGIQERARAEYIALRAGELHSAHYNQQTQARAANTRAGLMAGGRIALLILLSAASFIIPGTGQLATKRHLAATAFFAPWALGIVASIALSNFALSQFELIPLMILTAVFLTGIQIWAAVDFFIKFQAGTHARTQATPLGPLA